MAYSRTVDYRMLRQVALYLLLALTSRLAWSHYDTVPRLEQRIDALESAYRGH